MGFEHRRKHEQTVDYLGRVLDQYLNIPGMAVRARLGHFDDYFCPKEVDDGMNIHRLVAELRMRGNTLQKDAPQKRRINEVIMAAMAGEFDGTKAEAERWAASKEGQESARRLMEGK